MHSALSQSHAVLEVLVADDGSSDHTAAVIAEFDDRVIHIPLQHCGLPGVVRNAALKQARGEWVAFLDSDDLWHPEKTALQLAESSDSVGFICCNAEYIDENDRPHAGGQLMYASNPFKKEPDALKAMIGGLMLATPSVLCRTAVLREAGGFGEDPKLRICEDYDLWLRCATLTQFAYLHAPLVQVRRSPHGHMCSATAALDFIEARMVVRERFRAYLGPARCDALSAAFERNWRSVQHARYKAHIESGQWLQAVGPWLSVLRSKILGSRR